MTSIDFINDPSDPRFQNAEYRLQQEWSELPSALYKGNNYVKEFGEYYLPRHIGEEPLKYNLRLERSVLFNVFGNFINKISIIPFRNGVSFSESVPEVIQNYTANIDLLGTNIETWALNFYKDANITGISHFLVENPIISPNRTIYDDIVEGDSIRPYFVHIPSKDLYGWRYTINNSKLELEQIRYCRYVTRTNGRFGSKKVKEYVVYERDLISLYEEMPNEKGELEAVLINQVPNTLGYIPLVTLNLNQVNFMVAKPPFMGLANLNLRHYQTYSDQINIIHYSRIPILFGKGLSSGDPNETKEYKLTPGITLLGPENSDLKFVEHTGSCIKTGLDDIKDLEDKMSVLSGEYYTRAGAAALTATSHILSKIESGVTPGGNIRMLESALNQGLQLMLAYDRSIPSFDGGINLNTEDTVIPETVNFQYVTNMFAQGIISREAYLKEAKRRNILDDDTILSEEAPPEPEVARLNTLNN